MTMIDTFKYDENFYVHDVDSDFESGETYSDLDDAIEAAKNDALMGSSNMEITHVLVRLLKRVIVETRIEDV